MDHIRAPWSDLSPELWTVILKRLETYIDVLRCRGVCRSWRVSLPPINAVSPLLPLHVPYPPNDDADYPIKDSLLIPTVVYRLSHHQTPNSVSSSSSSSSSQAKGWFAMMERTRKGKLLFLRPIYLSYHRYRYKSLLEEVNLLDFRIAEVAKSYKLLNTKGIYVSGIRKVVMFPDSPWIDAMNCTVVAVYEDGKLGFVKLRDQEWTLIEKQNFEHGDLIASRGQLYAVDRRGIVFSIDSSTMKLVQICPPLCDSGKRKHLVECGGEVYVVDQFDRRPNSDPRSEVDFKVYKVDLDCGRLEEVNNLGNEAFILGEEVSFSVSETDFEAIQRNCIYYPRSFIGELSSIIHVFDLEERIVKSDNDEQIFKPPPMLLDQNAPDQYYYFPTVRLAY